ncbi:hypothetical protein CBP34_12345 [Acidovorax carolinensis]|uniref:Uncharacterized protein n=1 Tax=Acidovorax carolinensis TaxID=553814 RepID=A0A240U361_9BURK|nr:hypothetical protein CBP34_12345 [Acidovorax carolinensis]
MKLAHGQPGNKQLNIFETEMKCCTFLRLSDPVLQFNREFFQIRNILLRQAQLLGFAILDPICIGCRIHPCHLGERLFGLLRLGEVIHSFTQVIQPCTQNLIVLFEGTLLFFKVLFVADTETQAMKLSFCIS